MAITETAQTNPADAGRQLRLQLLASKPGEIGFQPSAEFSKVYGILIDWPVDDITATVVALADGNASLYTTSTFGIIGGAGHEEVRKMATKLVTIANHHFDDGVSTADFSYPAAGHVKFYLLTYGGVKVIDASYAAICTMKDRYSDLFGAGQDVVTQLRLLTEKK